MPRPCSICSHKKRYEIDQALKSGESLRTLAGRFSVTSSALNRHKKQHLSGILEDRKTLQEKEQEEQPDDPIAFLQTLRTQAAKVIEKAEQDENADIVLKGIHEAVRIEKLLIKLSAQAPKENSPA